MLKFEEVDSEKLNCGWCMGGGVVGGIAFVGCVLWILT